MDQNVILKYLESKVPNFTINKKTKPVMFTCPSCEKHNVAMFIPETNFVSCLSCGLNEDIIGLAKLLDDVGFAGCSDDKIKDALCSALNINSPRLYKEVLDFFEKSGFDLTPLVKNSKRPFEQDWVNNEHKTRWEWEKWLEARMNIGIKTGKRSGITIIDVDQADIPADIDLAKGNPLIQKTGRGWHLIYKYVDLPTTKIEEWKIDILNDGKQAVVYPSVIIDEETKDESKRSFITPLVLTEMPEDLLKILKNRLGNSESKTTQTSSEAQEFVIDESAPINLIGQGGRNNSLIQLGGIFRKELNNAQTEFTLSVLNQKLCSPPLNQTEFRNVIKMLDKYIRKDEKDLANQIFKYLNIVEFANAKEIRDALGFPKEEIDKALAYLVKELLLIKRGRNFSIVKRANWKTSLSLTQNVLDFKMPYFGDHANLCYGDNVLLGSGTKHGKTTIAMNIVKQISDQLKANGSKRRLYYITSEAGSRFMTTAMNLGLSEGDFVWDFVSDPTKINLEDDAITILDWLMIEDKANTDAVMKYFVDQLNKTNGFLITFMQIKETGDWFAPNMVKQFPALAARYMYTDETGVNGQWIMDAIREPKKHVKKGIIPCRYDFNTRTLNEITA